MSASPQLRKRNLPDNGSQSQSSSTTSLSSTTSNISAFFAREDRLQILHPTLFVLFVAFLLRLFLAMQSYSGESAPPKYGDYEAHRHWMEITVNLPVTEWYKNSKVNDLKYWPIDYPPLSAYWAWITGKLAQFYDPKMIELIRSHGYESAKSKLFMRSTVLVSDLLVFMPSAFYLANSIFDFSKLSLLVLLISPPLLLIDHAHFQYNLTMIGFMMMAAAFIINRRFNLAVISVLLSVLYKQMSLLCLPAFVAVLFGEGLARFQIKKSAAVFFYLQILFFALLTVASVFYPFLESPNTLFSVFKRLFPLWRGLFEDKVANFWCILAIFTKFHERFTIQQLFRICNALLLLKISPVVIGLIKYATRRQLSTDRFLLGLAYICLCGFLFSYHVHEKTILIPFIVIAFLSNFSPWLTYFLTLWSTFSLYPLMQLDKLEFAYFCTLIIWQVAFYLNCSHRLAKIGLPWKLLIIISIDFLVLYHLVQMIFTVPADLLITINVTASFVAFSITAAYLFIQFFRVN